MRRQSIGRECAPLLVIDNVVADAEELVDFAASRYYGDGGHYYPGVRAKTPLTYQRFVLERLAGLFGETFGVRPDRLRFTMCQLSLVTTPAANLSHLQRIPHIDSVFSNELAFIH